MQMGSNFIGWAVGGGAVASTALYQIWAGTKQKELGAGSMQVFAFLACLASCFDPNLALHQAHMRREDQFFVSLHC